MAQLHSGYAPNLTNGSPRTPDVLSQMPSNGNVLPPAPAPARRREGGMKGSRRDRGRDNAVAGSDGPQLLFVHNTGNASRNKWSVDRRAINAHVQKEQASRKRIAARKRLHPSATTAIIPTDNADSLSSPPETTASVRLPKPQRIAISALVHGEEFGASSPPSATGSARTSSSPATASTVSPPGLSQPWTQPCPVCGSHPGSEDHGAVHAAGRHSPSHSTGWGATDPRSMNATLTEWSHANTAWKTSLSPTVNPLANASAAFNQRMTLNLDYWFNYLIPLVIPHKMLVDCINEYTTQLIATEPTALYGLLALASFHYDTGAGTPESKAIYESGSLPSPDSKMPDYVVYKKRSIDLVNECMQNYSDATSLKAVFTTMCLIALEICGLGNTQVGSPLDIAEHVQGLQKLLTLRGGFHDIPIVATEQVYTAVYYYAACTMSPPLLTPPVNNLAPPRLPDEPGNTTRLIMAPALTSPPIALVIHPTIRATISQLIEVLAFQSFAHNSGANPRWISELSMSDMNYINLTTFHLIYTLLALPFDSGLQSWQPSADNTPPIILELQEPLRVALLIFFYANWRMHDAASPIFRSLIGQLKASLDLYANVHHGLFAASVPSISTTTMPPSVPSPPSSSTTTSYARTRSASKPTPSPHSATFPYSTPSPPHSASSPTPVPPPTHSSYTPPPSIPSASSSSLSSSSASSLSSSSMSLSLSPTKAESEHERSTPLGTSNADTDAGSKQAVRTLMLWILFLGAHVSSGQRERPWFVLQIARGLHVLGLSTNWDALHAVLSTFFYSDDVYASSFQAIFEESRLLFEG